MFYYRRCLIPEITNRSMTTSGRSWRNRWVSWKLALRRFCNYFCPILCFFNPYVTIAFLLSDLKTFLCRLTSQTALRWGLKETTCWRTPTDASSQLRGQTCWRHDCGWSLREKRDWTMAVWPGSGSSSCLRRCSTRTMDCLSILPRESLFRSSPVVSSIFQLCINGYRHPNQSLWFILRNSKWKILGTNTQRWKYPTKYANTLSVHITGFNFCCWENDAHLHTPRTHKIQSAYLLSLSKYTNVLWDLLAGILVRIKMSVTQRSMQGGHGCGGLG